LVANFLLGLLASRFEIPLDVANGGGISVEANSPSDARRALSKPLAPKLTFPAFELLDGQRTILSLANSIASVEALPRLMRASYYASIADWNIDQSLARSRPSYTQSGPDLPRVGSIPPGRLPRHGQSRIQGPVDAVSPPTFSYLQQTPLYRACCAQAHKRDFANKQDRFS